MGRQVPIFQYVAVQIPPEKEANVPALVEGVAMKTPAEMLAEKLTEMSARGELGHLLVFPGFMLCGKVSGFAVFEQTIEPGVMLPGQEPGQGRNNRR